MADVKWIKLNTTMFDNRKIRQIECLPEGYAIIVTWVKLLCLAGNINDGGFIYFTKEIPYTEQMLSTQFNIPLQIIQLALKVFQQFDMVDIIDDILHISNWEKYQNVDRMMEIREYNRLAKQRSRERKRLQDVNDKSMTSQSCHETDIDIEEDKDIDKDTTSVADVIELYSSICKSYPAIKSVSEARKKAIKARLKTYSLDDFKTLFDKAEASSFLKGKNDRNWTATFDWLVKDSNMAKVIDGNYDDRKKQSNNSFNNFQQNQYNMDELEKLLGGG